MTNATILAIDPGPRESGYVIAAPLDKGRPLLNFGHINNQELRARMANATDAAKPGIVAIEDLHSWNVRAGNDLIETAKWVGRFMELSLVGLDCPPKLLKRRDVCYALTGDAHANKRQIRNFLINRYGPDTKTAIGIKSAPGPLYGLRVHTFDALALAVVCAEAGTIVAPPSPPAAMVDAATSKVTGPDGPEPTAGGELFSTDQPCPST